MMNGLMRYTPGKPKRGVLQTDLRNVDFERFAFGGTHPTTGATVFVETRMSNKIVSRLRISNRNILRPELHADRHVVSIPELPFRKLEENRALSYRWVLRHVPFRSRLQENGYHTVPCSAASHRTMFAIIFPIMLRAKASEGHEKGREGGRE